MECWKDYFVVIVNDQYGYSLCTEDEIKLYP